MNLYLKKHANDRSDHVMVNAATAQSTISSGPAVNVKLFARGESTINVGYSADSGCEEIMQG